MSHRYTIGALTCEVTYSSSCPEPSDSRKLVSSRWTPLLGDSFRDESGTGTGGEIRRKVAEERTPEGVLEGEKPLFGPVRKRGALLFLHKCGLTIEPKRSIILNSTA
jgi:hypothetical protein